MPSIALSLLLLACASPVDARDSGSVYLRDNWKIQSSEKVKAGGRLISAAGYPADGWRPVAVPTTVLAGLVENKVFPDPYYGLNLKSIPGYRDGRWFVMPEGSPFRVPWWYRTEFSLPAAYRGKHLTLHLDGINYKANVWLNGRKAGDSATLTGMFRRFEIPISEYAVPGGENCLAVEIIPPGLLPDIKYNTKQVEATTGWDDHNPQPPDMNMGIWQDVFITATGPVALRHPYVTAHLDLPSLASAQLTVSVEVNNVTGSEAEGELTGEIEKVSFSQPVKLAPRETRLVKFTPGRFKQLNIAKPRVWWPNPVGPAELYELRLRFTAQGEVSDSTAVRFGIREATTYLDRDGWRGYRINGKRILIRGGAWMTSDMLLRLSPKRYEALIRYAKEANFNMLRSEGFSIRETEEFYSLCDRYGIMVTQQIFGRSIPDEQLAIACVRDTILRIRNHPSLVHFLGHDETFPTPTLDKAYRKLIAEYIPDRSYQPHSGAFDVKDRFRTGGTRTGTLELWTYANPSHYYTHKEDGAWGFAQSGGIGGVVSPAESMRKMMPEQDLWPPWSEAWSFHTVIQGGRYFDAMLKALEARYGAPKGIDEFCRKAQAMNYESARGMFEAYGRNKYSALGITTWKYDAAWPASPTWQYVDWNLYAGGAYYGAKKACEPLHVQYSYDDRSIYVVNGFYRDFRGLKVTARVFDLDSKERLTRTAKVDVGPDGKTQVFVLDWPEKLTTTFFLSLKLQDGAGELVSENCYWLSTVPDVPGVKGEKDDMFYARPKSAADFTGLSNLPPVELESSFRIVRHGKQSVARVNVRNPGSRIAFFVRLAISKGRGGEEVVPAYWEDNYLTLLPGESREVGVSFAAEDLEGMSPALRVTGWNSRRERLPAGG